MKCPKCGYEMKDNHLFCMNCGEKVSQEDPIESQTDLNEVNPDDVQNPDTNTSINYSLVDAVEIQNSNESQTIENKEALSVDIADSDCNVVSEEIHNDIYREKQLSEPHKEDNHQEQLSENYNTAKVIEATSANPDELQVEKKLPVYLTWPFIIFMYAFFIGIPFLGLIPIVLNVLRVKGNKKYPNWKSQKKEKNK